jgi:hypothetical protein
MATSSILGGERPPVEPKGTDEESLGPSDSSDSGSDALGTGDRAATEGGEAGFEEATNADILPDRVGVFPDDAFEASTSVDEPDAASVDELAAEIEADEGDEEDDDNADTAEDA